LTANSADVAFSRLPFPPLLQHDWQRFTRNARLAKIRRVGSYAVAGIVAIFALIDAAFPMRNPGDNLFSTLTFCAFLLLLSAGFGIAARFAVDRDSGIFGLLLMTPTSTTKFFLNRALVQTLIVLYYALGFLPFYGIALLYGGVTIDRWLAIILYFPITAAFCCACGFIGPIFTTNPIQAESISACARFLLAGWPVALNYVKSIATGEPLPRWFLSLGPLQGAFQLFDGFVTRLDFLEFLLTIGITVAETILLVAIGSFALEHAWRRDAGFVRREGLLGRIRAKSHATWRAFLRPYLETQPLIWFAAHNRRHVAWAWLQISVLVLVWIAGFVAWSDDWVFPLSLYATAALTLFIVQVSMASRIRSRALELKNGELDFLTIAGVSPATLIHAEIDGLYLQFSRLRWLVRALIIICVVAPLFIRTWNPFALFTHLSTAACLLWASRLRPTAHLVESMYAALCPQQFVENQNKTDAQIGKFLFGQLFVQVMMRLNKSRYFPAGTGPDIMWGLALLGFMAFRIATAKRRFSQNFDRLHAFIRDRHFAVDATKTTSAP
jgi:hypothetical protein